MVTGEPMPVEKEPGDAVTGGTVNGTGALVDGGAARRRDTLLAQIVQMVGEAQRSAGAHPAARGQGRRVVRARRHRWSRSRRSRCGRSSGPEPRLAHALVNAVAVLIIACPCALGLATPMSIMVGTGRGAQAGVLVRNAEALERLENVDSLVVDKTGTLTEGRPSLAAVEALGAARTSRRVLRLAASLEQGSEHPLAAAIVRGARERGLALVEPSELRVARRARARRGTRGRPRGRASATRALLGELGVDAADLEAARARRCAQQGQTVMFVGGRRRARGAPRRRRPDQGDDAGGARRASRAKGCASSC